MKPFRALVLLVGFPMGIPLPLVTAAGTSPTRSFLPTFAQQGPERGEFQPKELAPGEVVEGEVGFQLDEFLTRLEGLGLSAVVGVEFEGEPVLLRGYGMADIEAERPVTLDTVFTTGSITKQFTAAAILALQDDGKLSVQDPLSKHFENVPTDKQGITLHHLLTHGSGLADPPAGDFDLRATAEWVRDWALACELEWEPGTRFAYRNVNFSLLGMIVEQTSGEPYEAFLRRRLFEPSGMKRTGYLLPGFAPESLAVGYLDGERWGTVLGHGMLPDGPCWTLRGNGGIHSTVGDMLRWHHALQEDRVLSQEARTLLETPFNPEGGGPSYAYGWSIDRSSAGGKLVAHNGGNPFFFADFLRFVDEGHCLFLATNVGSRVRESIAYELADILYGRMPREVPVTVERERAWLEDFAGRYPLGEDSSLEVVALCDRLRLTGTGPDAIELLFGPDTQERIEETLTLTGAVCAGEDQALLGVYRGRQGPESIRSELGEARARWARELGDFQGLGEACARSNDSSTRVVVEARYARGSAFLSTTWEAGGIRGFEFLPDSPFRGLPNIELFPFSSMEFAAYGDRDGLGLSLRFELDGNGRAEALVLAEPPIRIPRD